MSIKLQINWSNNNVISEGVRVYKSISTFTKTSLPEIYATIDTENDSFEDFNVENGQTYFYMLSCFLGEQEVFTECFETVANLEIPISLKMALSSSGAGGTGSIINIKVPVYNAGDVIVIVFETNVNNATNINVPSGFTLINTIRITNSTALRVCYRIVTESTTQNSNIPFVCDSATAIILTSATPITNLTHTSLVAEKTNPDSSFPSFLAAKNSTALFFGMWDSFYDTTPQTVSFVNATKIAGADYSTTSLKHGVAMLQLNNDILIDDVSMSVDYTRTYNHKLALISVLLTAS